MIQMRVDGGDKAGNVSRALERIAEAATAGAQVIILPEVLTLGWTHPSALTEGESVPGGETCQRLGASAKQHGVYVCAGLAEHAGYKNYNTAVLFSPQGELLLHHRKIHELAIGHPYYALGDRLQVMDTPLGRFGLMICADGFAPGQTISRALAMMGAEFILSPSAWAVPADYDNFREPYGKLWRDNYGPVCADYGIWIAGVSNVGPVSAGPWEGRKCIGCSLLVGPDGKQALMGPFGETAEAILYHEIQLSSGKERIGPRD